MPKRRWKTPPFPIIRTCAAKDAPKKAAAVKELNAKDKDFIQKAANAGVGIVADGKVAEARGGAKVKQIGSRLVADHSQTNKELEELAKKKGLGMGSE